MSGQRLAPGALPLRVQPGLNGLGLAPLVSFIAIRAAVSFSRKNANDQGEIMRLGKCSREIFFLDRFRILISIWRSWRLLPEKFPASEGYQRSHPENK